MTVILTIPVKVHCEKCEWSETLDYAKHGPEVFGPVLFFGLDLANRPKVCPACGNAILKVERGLLWDLINHPLNTVERKPLRGQ